MPNYRESNFEERQVLCLKGRCHASFNYSKETGYEKRSFLIVQNGRITVTIQCINVTYSSKTQVIVEPSSNASYNCIILGLCNPLIISISRSIFRRSSLHVHLTNFAANFRPVLFSAQMYTVPQVPLLIRHTFECNLINLKMYMFTDLPSQLFFRYIINILWIHIVLYFDHPIWETFFDFCKNKERPNKKLKQNKIVNIENCSNRLCKVS